MVTMCLPWSLDLRYQRNIAALKDLPSHLWQTRMYAFAWAIKVPGLNSCLRDTNQEDCPKGVKKTSVKKNCLGSTFGTQGFGICGRFENLRRQNPLYHLPQGNHNQNLTRERVRKPRSKTWGSQQVYIFQVKRKSVTDINHDCHLSLYLFPLNHLP